MRCNVLIFDSVANTQLSRWYCLSKGAYAGSGYTVGDIITIAGGSAKIQVLEITNGGANLDKLEGPPILEVNNPNDNETGLQNKSTDDGNPEFILKLSPNELKFEVVTKDGGADLEASLKMVEIMSQQR